MDAQVYCKQDDNAMQVSSQSKVIKKRVLVEVFALRIVQRSSDQLDSMGGLIMFKGSDKSYVLYEDLCDERRGPQFDSIGYLTLIGPECGVEVQDVVVIYPCFFGKYFPFVDMSKGSTVWKNDDSCMNKFIRKGVRTYDCLMQVDFAVYSDAVEARFEIIVSDFNFEGLLQQGNSIGVYGTIKASNSTLIQSEAKSDIFNVTHQDCITHPWPPSDARISLPLTRNVTVIPRESALIVDISLSLSCTSQSTPIAFGSAVFDPTLRLCRTVEEKIVDGLHGKVKVKVIWSP